MKGKKLLSLTLVLCLTVALAVSNVVTVSADGDYYTGTPYTIESILENQGYMMLDGQTTYAGGRTVEYRASKDADGNAIAEGDAAYDNSTFTEAPAEITFNNAGEYTFVVTIIDTGDQDGSFTLTVVAEDNEGNDGIYKRISGVAYNVSDLLDSFGLKPLDGQSLVTGGRTVKYKLTSNEAGTAVQEDDDYAEAKETAADGTLEFKNVGTYTVNVYTGTGDEAVFEKSFVVTVAKNVEPVDEDYNKTSIKYKTNLGSYTNKVQQAADGLITGDSFEVPSLENYIISKDFAYSTIQKKVYYCAPDATSYTQGSTVTTSEASFTVDKLGTYTYYVLFADVFGNEMKTENLVLGQGGWYKTENNDGETQTGSVVIPVFSFTVGSVKAPEISVKVSENAYIGLNYEVKSFNIVSDNYNTVYKLYYSETYYDKDDTAKYANDTAYMQDVTAQGHSEDITDELNTASLTFTPEKKGYYYVEVKVVDNYNNADVAMSRAIACLGEAQSVTVEKEFAKNNVTSIVFLSIAGVCFIAIIVLLLVKPKEKQTVEVEGETDNTEKK